MKIGKTGSFGNVSAAIAALMLGAIAGSASAVTLTSGNASLNYVEVPGQPIFGSSTTNDVLFSLDTGGQNLIGKMHWAYRLPNNNQNTGFSTVSTPVRTQPSSDTLVVTYTNAGPGVSGQTFSERFDARVTVRLSDGAVANRGIVEHRCVFTSSAGNAYTGTRPFNIFFFVEPNLSTGTNNGLSDNISVTDNQFVRLALSDDIGNWNVEAYGRNPSNYQIGTVANVRGNSISGGSFNLTTAAGATAAPLIAQNVAYAFQWTVDLAAGQTRVFSTKIAFNTRACPSDFNNDGVVDVNDIFSFLAGWFASNERADVNLDNARDVNDIFAFLAQWFSRC